MQAHLAPNRIEMMQSSAHTLYRRLCLYVLSGLALGMVVYCQSDSRTHVLRDANGQALQIRHVNSTGDKVGRHFLYYPNGQLKAQMDFEQGRLVGEYLEWHPTGMPAKRMQFVNGHEEGAQRGWTPQGTVEFAYDMQQGRRFGLVGTMPCVVKNADRKQALQRYLTQQSSMTASTKDWIVRAAAQNLPIYNDPSFAPKWLSNERVQEHQVDLVGLQDHQAVPMHPRLLQQKPTVLVFFFAGCTSLCPTTLAQLKILESNAQGRVAERLNFLGVTVTPLQDDVKTLHRYAQLLDLGGNWHLLTGSVEAVEQFAKKYFFAKSTTEVHTERAFLIDQNQRIRGIYNATQPADLARLAQDAQRLLESATAL